MLLSTLFISSCYWQPFPLDTPLSTPWAENITTFAEALNSTLSVNYTGPIPTVIRAVDRCWCDLSSGTFFVPFNVSNWERASVLRLKQELERQQQRNTIQSDVENTLNGTLSVSSPSAGNSSTTMLNSSSEYFPFRFPHIKLSSLRNILSKRVHHDPAVPQTAPEDPKCEESAPLASSSSRELDLRPYGIDLILDYDWSRS